MLSIRLNGDYLEVKTETKLGPSQWSSFVDFMRSIPNSRYIQQEYKWSFHKEYIDMYVDKYEDVTAWYNTIEEIKGIEEIIIPEFPMIEDFGDFLLEPYDFQKQGISFLSSVNGGIIGDEMGLGKTLSTMGAAHTLWKEGKVTKVLVVCPASLKYQWSKEIDKFLGHKNIVIDGSTTKKKYAALDEFITGDYLFGIINYELVRSLQEELSKHHYDVIILDEAHRMKNKDSQTYKAVSSLKSNYRYAATGTPMQNNVEELWALVNWVMPGLLGKITEFKKRYIVYATKFGRRFVPSGNKRLGELRKRISPVMLRRMKADVATDLPPMIYHRRDIVMNTAQRKMYEAVQDSFLELMTDLQSEEVKGYFNDNGEWVEEKRSKEDQILGYLYMMIAISDHPSLLSHGTGMAKHFVDYIPENPKSPKLEELISICAEQLEAGVEKIVIFTQYARMQVIIEQELSKLGKVALLNGSMSSAARQEQVDTFRDNPEYKFFVLTDAGNYGINLQFANTLIEYDAPWNPSISAQRHGRVHRIGSTHSVVNIINLVTLDTIDEKIQEAQERKRELGEAIVDRNESERSMMNELIASIKKES